MQILVVLSSVLPAKSTDQYWIVVVPSEEIVERHAPAPFDVLNPDRSVGGSDPLQLGFHGYADDVVGTVISAPLSRAQGERDFLMGGRGRDDVLMNADDASRAVRSAVHIRSRCARQ